MFSMVVRTPANDSRWGVPGERALALEWLCQGHPPHPEGGVSPLTLPSLVTSVETLSPLLLGNRLAL